MTKSKSGRMLELEGLRALAAFSVVLFHTLYMFYPASVVGAAAIQHGRFEDNLFGSPVFSLFSGGLAVMIFFVLSGIVLSASFLNTGDTKRVKDQAARRYFRLMLPALGAVIIAALLLMIGANQNRLIATTTGSDWLSQMWNFTPNLFGAIWEGIFGIFAAPGSIYDPVLWTMHYEFIGSLLVFGFLLMFGKSTKRWLVYALIIFLAHNTMYLAFVAGLGLADLAASNKLPKLRLGTGAGVLLLGLVLGGVPAIVGQSGVYSVLTSVVFWATDKVSALRILGAVLIVTAVMVTPAIARLLSRKHISNLGKYTFSLYLMHKLVLFTLTAASFNLLIQSMGYNRAVLLSLMISIPVLALVTYLFERYVDAPSINFARHFSQWFTDDKKSLHIRMPQWAGMSRLASARHSKEDIPEAEGTA